ncbi:MAG: hypothetical protein LBC08_04115 [Campylobacteraceae bacterium]|nr:hypothetical protein [Campylobacteraceae bacterium]
MDTLFPTKIKIKPKGDKIVFCRPHGGLNDMLVQIEKCYRYAYTYNRSLYIDTSRSGFLDDFGRYFVAPVNVYFGTLDFLNPPFDCYPKCLSDNIAAYEVLYDECLTLLHAKTNTKITFDFNKNYKEQILVHEQAGGGAKSIFAIGRLRLKDNIKIHIRTIIDLLGEYDAIHVRNSDYKTDYKKFFNEMNEKLGGKIVLCTDSYECQAYAKEFWGDRLHIVTNVPDTKGKPLHENKKLDRFQTNVNALTDLFVLACSKSLYLTNIEPNKNHPWTVEKGWISGFASLAKSLHERKDLIDRLLYA